MHILEFTPASREQGLPVRLIAEEVFDVLKGPVKRVGAPQIPVLVAPTHEKLFKPGPEDVVLAVREAMG